MSFVPGDPKGHKRETRDTSSIFLQSHLPNNHTYPKPKPLTQKTMVSIKQFFSAHAKLYPASMVPGAIEEPVIAPKKVSVFKNFFKSSPWAAKAKAAVQPAPPVGETKYTLDHEMDALNLWSPWAAKTKAAVQPAPPAGDILDHEMDALNLWSPWAAKSKAAKGMAPLTERELENIKNKSWTVERRA